MRRRTIVRNITDIENKRIEKEACDLSKMITCQFCGRQIRKNKTGLMNHLRKCNGYVV